MSSIEPSNIADELPSARAECRRRPHRSDAFPHTEKTDGLVQIQNHPERPDPSVFLAGSERINLRVDRETKDLLKRAAAAENRTVTSFILNAARLRAEAVLEPTDRLVLTNEEFQRFLDEVESSPDVSEALSRAVRRSAKRGLSTSA